LPASHEIEGSSIATEPSEAAKRRRFDEIFRTHRGYLSDKWAQYLAVYERELAAMVERGAPLRLLEIGVQNGGSLQIWHKYLPAASRITGVDIDPRCAELSFPDGVEVITADAGDAGRLDSVLGSRQFDIVIDDGSHLQRDIIGAFRTLLPRLAPGGKYFIEDLHTSYWKAYGGGFRLATTAVEFIKDLADGLHLDHLQQEIDEAERSLLAKIDRDVCRISFYSAIAVIEKYPTPKTGRFARVMAGGSIAVSGPDIIAAEVVNDPDGFELIGRSRKPIINAALLAARQSAGAHYTALQAACGELAQAQAALAAGQSELAQAAARAAGLQAELAERDALAAALQSALSAAQAAAAQGRERSDALAAALASSQAMLAALDSERRGEVDRLRAALDIAETAAADAQQEIAALRGERETLRQETAALREQLSRAAQQAADSTAAAEAASAEAEAAKTALAAAEQVGRAALSALTAEFAPPSGPRAAGRLGRGKRRFAFTR
jgi:predicted  nucleic acid-binding Zn-ribbon protein